MTAGFSVSSSGVIVSFKRPGRCARAVFSPAAADGIRVGGPVTFIAAGAISATLAVKSAALARVPIWRPVPFVDASSSSAALAGVPV